MAKKSGTKKGSKKPAMRKTKEPDTPQQPDASGEIVVFAIRLKRGERDAIHAAAGSGKASQFVRGLALAAAAGDLKTIQSIVAGTRK